jgi:uncharacterized protein YjbI with pentapeptide repeats
LNTSDTGIQSATQAQLTLPSWPGGDLFPLEQEMKTKVAAGELVDGEGPFELADMRGWGKERVIRAAVLRYLLAVNDWPVDARGVQLRGVRIHGHLDLAGVTLRCSLRLADCYLDASEPVCLDHATAYRPTLARCHLAGLTGEMLSAREVNLTGSTLTGPLNVRGADITGRLTCRGAKLTGQNEEGNALVGDGMKVGGGVFLDREFTAAGAIRLRGADITGRLAIRGAKLTDQDKDDNALVGDGMKVGGDVFLDRGFTAAGRIALRSVRVGGSVYLRPWALAGADEVALDATGAQITGQLVWAPDWPVFGQVNLEGATVGHLVDDWGEGRPGGFWPTGGQLRLDGFTYDRFGGEQYATVRQRLEWICGQYRRSDTGWQGFVSQPYEQLTTVYRQAGKDAEARKVAIARRADLRRYGSLTWYRKAVNWFMDKTIKFGYQTWRVALGLAVVFVAFLVMTFVAQHHHAIVPVSDLVVGVHPVPVATRCTPSYPCFYPLGYAIDVVIPVIKVHQADFWGLDGWGWIAGSWAATVLGWAAVTLLAVGYTGLVRQQ